MHTPFQTAPASAVLWVKVPGSGTAVSTGVTHPLLTEMTKFTNTGSELLGFRGKVPFPGASQGCLTISQSLGYGTLCLHTPMQSPIGRSLHL